MYLFSPTLSFKQHKANNNCIAIRHRLSPICLLFNLALSRCSTMVYLGCGDELICSSRFHRFPVYHSNRIMRLCKLNSKLGQVSNSSVHKHNAQTQSSAGVLPKMFSYTDSEISKHTEI